MGTQDLLIYYLYNFRGEADQNIGGSMAPPLTTSLVVTVGPPKQEVQSADKRRGSVIGLKGCFFGKNERILIERF